MIDRAEPMRDSTFVECVLAATALLGGQLVLWGVTGPTGLFHGIEQTRLSISQVWYAAIALPLLQFLALRWLWRWAIWTVILVRVSRLPLATIATHPDRAAGLRFLSGPRTGFAAFELAFGSMLAGAWGMQLLDGRVTVPSLLPTLDRRDPADAPAGRDRGPRGCHAQAHRLDAVRRPAAVVVEELRALPDGDRTQRV